MQKTSTMQTTQPVGLILAGGQAKRFGGKDKGELRLKNKRLFDHVYHRFNAQIDKIWLSGTHNYGLDIKVLADRADGPKGPLAGLYSAYIAARPIAAIRAIITVPIDGPFLPGDLYQRLSKPGTSATAYDGTRLHPTFALWKKVDLENFFLSQDLTQNLALKDLSAHCRAEQVLIKTTDAFMNINTEEDLLKAHNLLQS